MSPRRPLGHPLGAWRRILGVSGRSWRALWTSLAATRASQRGSWELPGGPGDRLGMLLGRLGKPSGAPRERWERTRRKSEKHFSLRNSFVFEVPGGFESKPKSCQSGLEGPRGVCESGFECLWESDFEKSGFEASQPSGTQRNPAQLSLASRSQAKKTI